MCIFMKRIEKMCTKYNLFNIIYSLTYFELIRDVIYLEPDLVCYYLSLIKLSDLINQLTAEDNMTDKCNASISS